MFERGRTEAPKAKAAQQQSECCEIKPKAKASEGVSLSRTQGRAPPSRYPALCEETSEVPRQGCNSGHQRPSGSALGTHASAGAHLVLDLEAFRWPAAYHASRLWEQLRQFWADHFSRRFSPRRPPLRRISSMSTFYLMEHSARQAELGLSYDAPRTRLDDRAFVFRGGRWAAEGPPGRSWTRLRPPTAPGGKAQMPRVRSQELLEENNYLRLQQQVLMDMLTETTARLQLLEKTLDREAGSEDTARAWQARRRGRRARAADSETQ
ncbi:protein chibby homolog 3 [Artibeus jamaicensis]|uniref:protein chibby homolog 3 n=1 Tax=Artibeus jamaicensis TaxID=9417 RepID=UPI00235A9E6D|nr:protein chibby homolog 3 [Artibeus jamaicensis]